MRWRALTVLCAAACVTSLLVPAVAAHPRTHRHAHRSTTAVIVVGKPRPVRRPVVIEGTAHGVLDLNVKPKATEVWVDGTLRGRVGAFDGHPQKLHLPPGVHQIKLITPEGVRVARDVRVRAGVELDIGLDLR